MRQRAFSLHARFSFSSLAPILTVAALAVSTLAAAPALAGGTATTVSGSTGTTRYGEDVTFTARVRGAGPTGTVTFKDGSKDFGSGPLSLLAPEPSLGAMNSFTCALTVAGGVECWGNNAYGRLGDGNMGVNATTPVPVVGLSSGAVAVSVGYYSACALTDDAIVKCWGSNDYGQLTDGTTDDSDVPVDIAGLPDGIVAVSVGGSHICALTDGGAVWCWGSNITGQLGNGTLIDSPVPVPVEGLSSGVAGIAAGFNHTCATLETGAAKCWGINGYGQLGDGTKTISDVPVDVTGLPDPVSVISANQNHTCAVTTAGAAYCWGYGAEGELGNGANGNSKKPVAVTGLSSGVATIEAGWAHTCAAKADGSAWCWGYNNSGQLGDGGTTQANTPQAVSGLTGVAALAAGAYHSCALTKTGAVSCWGDNASGKLGNGNAPTDSHTPVSVTGYGTGAALIAAEAVFTTHRLSAGVRSIVARYDGDSLNSASTSGAHVHVVRKGKTKIKEFKLLPRVPEAGKNVRVKITVKAKAPSTGNPRGRVVIRNAGKKLGSFRVAKGKASIRLSGLKQGSHKLKAVYRGNKNWKRSTHAKTVRAR